MQVAALELLAQAASAVWSAIPVPPPQLVSIALRRRPNRRRANPVQASQPLGVTFRPISSRSICGPNVSRACRRPKCGSITADAVQAGRSRRNLYDLLRQPIDDARQGFRNQFFAGCPSMVDYLHLELTRTLANDDPDLFGSTYPGPLV